MKGGGRAPPILTSQANFTLMMECTPESGRNHALCVLRGYVHIIYSLTEYNCFVMHILFGNSCFVPIHVLAYKLSKDGV